MIRKYITRYLLVLLLGIISFTGCNKKHAQEDFYTNEIQRSIGFFDSAFDAGIKVYYSDVDENGKATGESIHTVALSRMLYGLAYASPLNPDYENKALALTKYQLENMIGRDSIGTYFIPTVRAEEVEHADYLDIWQQAYGLCGLTELYRNSLDKELLPIIRENTNWLIKRFRDEKKGGFFADYKIGEGAVSGSKTLQSLMYPITAFMGNLWLADVENRTVYEKVIKEHLDIISRVAWNDSLGWVNLRFNDNWEPVFSDKDVVSPGHNFQLAALFLRSEKWTFLSEEERRRYQRMAKEIIRTTMNKPIWSCRGIGDGFFENINPHNDQVVSAYKSWWQHCEALIALSFVKDEYNSEFDQLFHFYFNTFIDEQSGGEWAKVGEGNSPIIEPKGQRGKSVYHHIELIRFLREADVY
ncbi:MAG: AGE family epimerase/isomerase [Carboxylicivirga sp.]|jgi:mannose/cellobiose epimerase-like protein (N-acyl-D-glucosamine 2-epimerase family)|nr:AGE family epimerase/isomerase [Carboxylicivirga sp.]